MTKFSWAAAGLVSALSVATAHAGTVAVSGPVNGILLVQAADAGVDEVLARLAQHQGFTVDGALNASASRRISGKISGSLDDVLRRLLRAESFTVVYASAGVERIVLSGAGTRAPTIVAESQGPAREVASLPSRAPKSIDPAPMPVSSAGEEKPAVTNRGETSPVPGGSTAVHGGPVPSAAPVVFEGQVPRVVLGTGWAVEVPSPGRLASIQVPSVQIEAIKQDHPR